MSLKGRVKKYLCLFLTLTLVMSACLVTAYSATEKEITDVQGLILKFIKLDDASRADIVDRVIKKITIKDYQSSKYIDIVKKYVKNIGNQALINALKQIASTAMDKRKTIEEFILMIDIKDVGSKADGFMKIRNIINLQLTGEASNNDGFGLFMGIIDFYFMTYMDKPVFIAYDGQPETKILFKLDSKYNYVKNKINPMLKYIGVLEKNNINDVDSFLAKLSSVINVCPDNQIYEFKKYLNDNKLYSGKLPKPQVPTTSPASTPEPTVAPTDVPEPTVAPTDVPEPTVAPTEVPEPTVTTSGTPGPTVVPTTPNATSAPSNTPKKGGKDKGSTNRNNDRDTSPNATPAATPVNTPVPSTVEIPQTPIPAAPVFKDLKGHWSEKIIMGLVEKGIVGGYPDGTIKPDGYITRAEAAVTIIKALKLDLNQKEDIKFKDNIPDWAKSYIQVGLSKGIIKGYTDGTFKAQNMITRKEATAMIMRAFAFAEKKDVIKLFKDITDSKDWAFGYINGAIELGLIKGYDDNTFRPQRSITRAEFFVILSRSLEKK